MTKGQKTALTGVVIVGAGIGAYMLYKSTQKKPKVIAPPPQYPSYPGRQPRPLLDFFGGLVGSGKVSGAINQVSGWFGKGKGGSNSGQVYGPVTEAQSQAGGNDFLFYEHN